MNETSILVRAVQTVVPEPCYTKTFVDLNFFDVECFKIVLSKCLGYSIILGSVLVKLPQIIKIIKGKSGEGISFFGQLFELIGISANASYGFQHGFPFSSYGEGIFLGLQTTAVLFFVLFFGGNILGAFLFVGVYGGIMAYLLSPMVSMSLLAAIQTVNIVVVMAGKLLQALANYRNGSTGQLSAITVGLIFGGSVIRIFTSIQETGDQLVVITYMCSATCNAILVGQMIYYASKKKQE